MLNDITLDVMDGMGGKYITFSRGKAKICMSPNVWRRFRQAIPELRNEGKKVRLTDRKSVSVGLFNNSLYTTLTAQGMFSKYHINLGEGHWKALITVLPQVDKIFSPGPIVSCPKCNNELRVVKLVEGCLQKSLLSEERVAEVRKKNMTVENQLGCECEYCGGLWEYGCHCHKVNCMDCSPECFCDACAKPMYYYYE